jgi:tetratricopeptide (TPR) repeat protein
MRPPRVLTLMAALLICLSGLVFLDGNQARAGCISITCFNGKQYPCGFDCKSLLPKSGGGGTRRSYTPRPKPRGPSPRELERIRGMRLDEANELGYEAYRKGDFRRAALYFQRALEYAPHNPTLQHNLKRARQHQAALQRNVEAARQKRLAEQRRLKQIRKLKEEQRKKELAKLKKEKQDLEKKIRDDAKKRAKADRRRREEMKKALRAASKGKALKEAAAAKGHGRDAAASAKAAQEAEARGQDLKAAELYKKAKHESGRVFDEKGDPKKAKLPKYTPSISPPAQVAEATGNIGRKVVIPKHLQNDPQITKMQTERKALESQYRDLDKDLALIRKKKEQYPKSKATFEVLEVELKQKQSEVKGKIDYAVVKMETYVIDLGNQKKPPAKAAK